MAVVMSDPYGATDRSYDAKCAEGKRLIRPNPVLHKLLVED